MSFYKADVMAVVGGNTGSVGVQRKGREAEGGANHRRLPGGRPSQLGWD